MNSTTFKSFENQNIIVTGGASGIGYESAKKLALSGANVSLWDMNQEQLATAQNDLLELGCQVETKLIDITDEKAVKTAMNHYKSKMLHVLVHCAGIIGPHKIRTHEIDLEGFEHTCRVNLIGSFILTKYAVQVMLPKQYGRILIMASIAGKEGNSCMSPYSASKAGVIGLIKASGKEYATTGITINGIAPGAIHTKMTNDLEPEQLQYMLDRIPMKRCGTVEEVSNLVSWVVSPEASFNTGFVFDLSGGRAVY